MSAADLMISHMLIASAFWLVDAFSGMPSGVGVRRVGRRGNHVLGGRALIRAWFAKAVNTF